MHFNFEMMSGPSVVSYSSAKRKSLQYLGVWVLAA